MMPHFVVYENAGRILRYGSCPSELVSEQANGDENVIPVIGQVSDATHYFDGKQIIARPENPTMLTDTTLTNIPLGSIVMIEGSAYPVDDGTAELSFSASGAYTVSVLSFPQVDAVFEVTA